MKQLSPNSQQLIIRRENSRIISESDKSSSPSDLNKFIQFIKFHKIKLRDIWKNTNKFNNFGINEFSECIYQSIGYKLSIHQLTAVNRFCTLENLVVPLKFINLGIIEWQQQLNEQINAKRRIRPKSCNPCLKNISCRQQIQFKATKQGNKLKNNTIQEKYQGFNSSLLQISRVRSAKKEIDLKKGINTNILQKKWNFIVKIGELNKWLTQRDQKIRYKVSNAKDSLQIKQYHIQKETESTIPERVLLMKYAKYANLPKNTSNRKKENKTNLKGTVLMVLQNSDKFTKNNLQNRINQRDQQLNLMLLQIIRMRSILQHQYNIMKENLINEL